MAQAPKRIWATGQSAQYSGRWWHETELKSGKEYIRADLVPQWQPIETAPAYDPHKKTRVIVWNRFSQAVDYVLADGDFWRARGDECSLSHWMPLPAPPA